MRYKNSTEYPFDHEFSTNYLATITPEDVDRYFKHYETYGNPDADPDIDRPQKRANTLLR